MDNVKHKTKRHLIVALIILNLITIAVGGIYVRRFHAVRRTYVEEINDRLYLLHLTIYYAKFGIQHGNTISSSLYVYNDRITRLGIPPLTTLLEGLFRHHGMANITSAHWSDLTEFLRVDFDDSATDALVIATLTAMHEYVMQAILELFTTDEIIPTGFADFERHPNLRISTRRLFEAFDDLSISLRDLQRQRQR